MTQSTRYYLNDQAGDHAALLNFEQSLARLDFPSQQLEFYVGADWSTLDSTAFSTYVMSRLLYQATRDLAQTTNYDLFWSDSV